MIRVFISLLIIFMCAITVVAKQPYFSLDTAKNAASHNNKGLERLQDGYYDMAIAEFQLAIDLNPSSKACAVYYNNLGETYYKLGYYAQAQQAYENALKIAPLNFLYYQNVVKSYKMEGLLQEKIQQYKALEETNSLYKVLLGLCYIENGDTKRGIIKLDEFCMQEPYLIITNGVKRYLRETLKLNY